MALNLRPIIVEGMIEETLPGLLFRVRLENQKQVLAHLAGKMKLNRIRVIAGDRVLVEMSSLEEKRGRIVRRL
ncbi:translation initiation factor IF-1 [Candidatus Jorgensenbacteria bacterium CG_4_10_14_0_8_um_filter_39_13]|uniref:Translation initiation factor IF-1 n=2 Tax=Candidatus Joergenseniibacteriota TaxID=1752739 RepID=A0A2M7RIJ2_9BACT|nr:MAG: translation initiation factor IF-1 [Candidatus Jorgensenbacteria bacterium CG11_big_fil_rev_8_21_14_0_20_38_23]PIV13288.1 MAG: translation initiation factor IF-1 [Candidatus Jorgensenbacteria bacterium CG03_land_8_20_14_0_80_38_39]PIW97829.1 MAG: translation initiation factor IF-1 [Candidatus Jorgensenbacteria bacterium CG_4_8_14_3_um_filter_38_10]PIY96583.1 MAG: translation initiation factor IF-1 [Candidatus Jorgensenbacteria bacterium CG_4_10_14_0_8_um_filter_39_13]PJA94793.1 MAG: tra